MKFAGEFLRNFAVYVNKSHHILAINSFIGAVDLGKIDFIGINHNFDNSCPFSVLQSAVFTYHAVSPISWKN